MDDRDKITIDKKAVARAIRKPLDAYYKVIGKDGYDWSIERPGNWEEEEDLFKAIFKSSYVSRHLDWLYVLEIVYAVIDHHPPLSAEQFAHNFEEAIIETTGQRDYLAIIPLGFRKPFLFPHLIKPSLLRQFKLGEFTFSPPATSAELLNKIIAKHNFPPVSVTDFMHAARTSHEALAREILITVDVHGAEDHLRFSVESKFRTLSRLIEVFANLFTGTDAGFGDTYAVNHFFLLNKTTGEFRRIPTTKSQSFNFELSQELLKFIRSRNFVFFFERLNYSKESMYARMQNSFKFFSMAFNSDDKMASFLFYVISIESIFSRDKSSPIKATLADFSSLLCFPAEHRLDAYRMFREAYDLRSSIVHSGVSFVTSKHVEVARSLAARALYCSMFLCENLNDGPGKLEDKFFDHLRDRKLGVTKAIVPREMRFFLEIDDHDE
jgi:hypothetical protein